VITGCAVERDHLLAQVDHRLHPVDERDDEVQTRSSVLRYRPNRSTLRARACGMIRTERIT
jgi:hypothetical protein